MSGLCELIEAVQEKFRERFGVDLELPPKEVSAAAAEVLVSTMRRLSERGTLGDVEDIPQAEILLCAGRMILDLRRRVNELENKLKAHGVVP